MQNPQDLSLQTLELMRMGTEMRFPVTCRGLRLLFRPLTIQETVVVTNETLLEIDRMPKTAQTGISYNTIFAKKTLMLASTESPISDRLGELTEYVLNLMTDREIAFLFDQYRMGCDKLDPSLESLPVDKILELAAELKKSPSEVTELSFLQLTSLCRYLTQVESPEDKSPGGLSIQ